MFAITLKRKRKVDDYLATFSNDPGRRVLRDLMKSCYFNVSFNSGGEVKSEYEAGLREGQRTVFIRILENMALSKTDILIMSQEETVNYFQQEEK